MPNTMTTESKELMEVVKIKLKDPVFMKNMKAHVMADFAEFLYITNPDVLAEAVIQKMNKGAIEHGKPPTAEELHKIHVERFDEHTDLIGWYFIYLNARHDL